MQPNPNAKNMVVFGMETKRKRKTVKKQDGIEETTITSKVISENVDKGLETAPELFSSVDDGESTSSDYITSAQKERVNMNGKSTTTK